MSSIHALKINSFICICLMVLLLFSCSISIQYSDPQNIMLGNGMCVDTSNHVIWCGLDNYVRVYDRLDETVTITGVVARQLMLRGKYLYYYVPKSVVLYRSELKNVAECKQSELFESERIDIPSKLADRCNLYGDRLCFTTNSSWVSSTDLNGTDAELYDSLADNHRCVIGYENGIYYFAYFTSPYQSVSIRAGAYNAPTELFVLQNVVDTHHESYNKHFICFKGYVYYIYNGNIYRVKLESSALPQLIYSGNVSFNTDDSNCLGITASGIYILSVENNIVCVNANTGTLKITDINYEEDDIWFVSSVDRELYCIRNDNIFKIC